MMIYRSKGSKDGTYKHGFTLVELAIVLFILSVILFIGIASWKTLVESRRLAKAKATLEEAKNCLIKRIYYTGAYPRFTTGVDVTNSSADVDSCIGNLRDSWGHPIRYLDSVDSSNIDIQGRYIIKDELEGIDNGVSPGPNANATIKLKNGSTTTVGDIAFVLISFGKDGKADDSSYGSLLPSSDVYNPSKTAATFNAPLDFSKIHDDVYLIVTSNEIRALLTQ